MRAKVVVTQPAHEKALVELRELCDVVVNDAGATWDRTRLVAECREADAILAFMTDPDHELNFEAVNSRKSAG